MRIEAPISVEELGFPIETKARVDLYKEAASLVYKKLEKGNLRAVFLELSDLPQKAAEVLRSGTRSYIVKKGGDGYLLYSTIITNPNDKLHHILLFSKEPWNEIVWKELKSKID